MREKTRSEAGKRQDSMIHTKTRKKPEEKNETKTKAK